MLGKRSEGFNPSSGGVRGRWRLICCISWGPRCTFLRGFPLLSDPSLMRITLSSETGLWGRYFGWGFIWDGHIKRYLAVSLLQWFLSGQPNESSAGDPKGGSGLSNSRPGFWNFQEQQWDGNISFVVRSPLITRGCVAVFSPVMGFCCLNADFLDSSLSTRILLGRDVFPLTKYRNHWVIIWRKICHYFLSPEFSIPLDMGIR